MRLALLVVAASALAAAQTPEQGQEIFAQTCGSGYCHGPRGSGGGAPRISARGFDQAFISNEVTRGVPNTAMPSFASTLKPAELNAVVAYVAKLNDAGSYRYARPPLAAEAERGRALFSDAVRGFARCSTCHEMEGGGIPVAAPIAAVPASPAAFRELPTPRVATVTVGEESMPVLVISKAARVKFYDLTSSPPVLRTEPTSAVRFADGSAWRHSSVTGAYNDEETAAMLAYLRAVVK